jgi:arylformamidase
MGRIHDITLHIEEGMIVYPGNPPIRVRAHSRISDGDDANVTELSFGSHTGTHVDAAHHFVDGAQTVDALPLDRMIGPARVAHIADEVRAIGPTELRAAGIEGESRVLLRTRNSALLDRSGFSEDFAYLSGDGARFLVDAGVTFVALDYLSIEGFDADQPVAHETLLRREIVVVEGVDLRTVPAGRYELICLPLKVRGIEGGPGGGRGGGRG